MSGTNFEPVRIGVVGMGNFGLQHALTLAGLMEADLVALVARRQASLDEAAKQLPGVPGWFDLDRAIDESGAEAWVDATSTASHVAVTTALLTAGKTVLLEKPIAVNLADAESLASLVKPDSSNLMLGHIVLFNSEFHFTSSHFNSIQPLPTPAHLHPLRLRRESHSVGSRPGNPRRTPACCPPTDQVGP